MSTESLELRLKTFRLPSFLAHYAELAHASIPQQAARSGWSHVRYLDELAALEAPFDTSGPGKTGASAGC